MTASSFANGGRGRVARTIGAVAAVTALVLLITAAGWLREADASTPGAAPGRGGATVDPGPARTGALPDGGWPSPPGQPAAGPGGRDYAHGRVRVSSAGSGDGQYWLFEPADPTPYQAPVVVFLHGWGAMVPDPYLGWIDHIVRKGRIVIFPRYQAGLTTPPAAMTDHAEAAVRAALEELRRGAHVRPELDKVAFVGHSLGGVIAANLAARAAAGGGGLPVPSALMVVEPGDPPLTRLGDSLGQPSIMEDYGAIPRQTLMLVVVGDEDRTVGERTARILFERAGAAPANKNYVILRSDRHGRPELVADHVAPAALRPAEADSEVPAVASPWMRGLALRLYAVLTGRPDLGERVQEPDALDFYGFWKLFDALTDAAFYFRHREVALGDTPQQRYMGLWSDGVPVREPEVLTAEEFEARRAESLLAGGT